MKLHILTALFLCLNSSFNLSCQEPTKWRGTEGNGIYPDKGLLKQWPQTGPEILWSFDGLGQGFSSPVISGGNIFIPTMFDSTGYVVKMSMDGKLIWKVPYGLEFTESYPGSRGSVTIAGNALYILSGRGKLVCMNATDGKIRWSKNLFKDFDGRQIVWGLNETVIVDGELLYCTPGGKKNSIIALNRQTGDLIWTSPGKEEKSAYCTPLLLKLPARQVLITHTESSIVCLDASSGKLLWSYPHTNQYAVHPNTPLFKDGSVFCFSGWGQGAVMLKLSSDGSSVQKQWTIKSFDNRMGGAVLIDGYVYGSGDADPSWQCLEWATGKKMYSSTAIGQGVVIFADGLLHCYSERGELALVKAESSGFKVISKTKVSKGSEQHWAHPVIKDGVLYLHHGTSLIAYKIK